MLNVGTTAGTVPDAADSRITVTQDATKGNNALNTRVGALETKPHARYVNTAPGTIATGDNVLTFPTARNTDPNVSADATFKTFTIQPGLWLIEANWRLNGTNLAGLEMDVVAGGGSTPINAAGALSNVAYQGKGPFMLAVARITVATAYNIALYNGSGSSQASAAVFGDACHVSFTRLSA